MAHTVQDDRRQNFTFDHPPQRIVSLLPSLTETVCVLGACDRLVGVDRYSNWPASVKALPIVGGGIDPNIEAVVRLQPDLVLAAGSTRGAERLEALGVRVLRLEPRTHADVQRVLAVLAEVLHLPKAHSQLVWRDVQQDMQQATQALRPQVKGVRVYVEVSSVPFGAGPKSFIGETLSRLGVGNVLDPQLGPFPQINPEAVLRAQPDVVMLADSSRDALAQRPGWQNLRAIQRGRVCVFSPAQSDVLVRAGPRLAEGARWMVDCLNRVLERQP